MPPKLSQFFRFAFAALFGISLLAAIPALALVKTSIDVDGDTSDWSVVLQDSENVLTDTTAAEGDLDRPQNNRDLRTFATTWDSENLYLFFRRVGNKASITYLAYVDLDDDGLLDASDIVLSLKFNGTKHQGTSVYQYVPANPTGDPITGDGVDEPGTLGAINSSDLGGRVTPDGREMEASVSWASLGLTPGQAIQFHASTAMGGNLPSQVEDNAGPLLNQHRGLQLTADGRQAAASPDSVLFAHRVTLTGNLSDLINLSAVSANGFDLELFSDPNGDGDPSDGTLMGRDQNGDGDFTDVTDSLSTAFDRDLDGLPDTGNLAAGSSMPFVVRVTVPAGVTAGTEDQVVLTARSSQQLSLSANNVDTIVVGAISISPDLARIAVEGTDVWYSHRVCNFSGTADSAALSTTSTLGWGVVLWSDPDGDGDPSDGTPITSTSTIPNGGCSSIVAVVSVPAGTALGTTDTLTVRAALNGSPAFTDDAVDRTTIAERLTFRPDSAAYTGAGGTVFYPATLTWAGFETGIFDLTSTTSLGSRVTIWSDPNRDGNPSDGTPIIIVGPLAPNGGSAAVVVEVRIPDLAQPADIEVTAVTATLRTDSTVSATVQLTTTVRGVQVFEDAAFTRPGTLFDRCGTVYALASGLDRRNKYRFVWNDSLAVERRVSSVNGDVPDGNGRLNDFFALSAGDPGGTWQIRLQYKQGNNWLDVTPGGVAEFLVTDDIGNEGGVYTLLDTNKPLYTMSGDLFSSLAIIQNPTTLLYQGSTINHILFRDADTDGLPTAGETYITSTGTAAIWGAGNATCGPDSVPDLGQGDSYSDGTCAVNNVAFTAVGPWRYCSFWTSSCGTQVASACMTISVGVNPSCLPLANAGPDQLVCDGDSTVLGQPAQAGFRYEWSPAIFLDNPKTAQPVATPEFDITYTLTVTSLVSGCTGRDTVLIDVSTPFVADAGGNIRVCNGGSRIIGVDPGASHGCSWTPTTGLSSATACMPVATPSRTTVYVVTWTHLASGCTDSDAMAFTVAPDPVADAGPDRFVCPASLGTIIGGPAMMGYTYRWSPVTGLSDPNVAQPTARPSVTTIYTVTVTELSQGCTRTDAVTVATSGPVADAGGPGPLTAPAVLGGACDPTLFYRWTPTAGLSDPNACNPVANPTVPTTYCLTVTDRNSGCTSVPSCVQVAIPNCSPAERPTAIDRLLAFKSGAFRDSVGFNWQPESRSVQGYRGYAVATKEAIPSATAGRRAFTTPPSEFATNANDPGVVPGPAGEIFFYQVVGVCQDGSTEGAL